MTLPLFSIVSETSQNAPCEAIRSKSEPRAVPEVNGPEKPSMDTPDGAAACPQYPYGCLACPDYRGTVRWWCRKLHWWKPWATPTGELPTVESRQGNVRHVYKDGTTRLVGIAAAPTIPASVIPPVPGKASTVQETKAIATAQGCR